MGTHGTQAEAVIATRLTPPEILERAETMAAKVQHVEHLRKRKALDAKNMQALIDEEMDEIERLARVISEQTELRKQGELRFMSDTEAQETLADVARHVGL